MSGSVWNPVGWINTTSADLINFIQNGMGAIVRTVASKLQEEVDASDFGSGRDAIVRAIVYANNLYRDNRWFESDLYTAPRTVKFSGVWNIAGDPIPVPSGIILDGRNATMIGTGNSATANTCFVSGYVDGSGVLRSNIGTPAEPPAHIINFMQIKGFKFINFAKAIQLQNCLTGCLITGNTFSRCWQNAVLDFCYYSGFTYNVSREPDVTSPAVAASPLAAFEFNGFVNAQELNALSIEKRALGIKITGGVNGLGITNVSIENGTTGIQFAGEVNPLSIGAGCYFESLTGTAIDLTENSAHRAVSIDHVWFNLCGTAIAGRTMSGGNIGANNYFLNCTNDVTFTDPTSVIELKLNRQRIPDVGSTVPVAFPKVSVPRSTLFESPYSIYSNISGEDVIRNQGPLGSIPRFAYFGFNAHIGSAIPFCSVSATGTATQTIYVDTKIVWDDYVMGIFSLKHSDNISTYQINGRFYGTAVTLDNAAGKTVVASNNAGFVRLALSTFNNASTSVAVEGIVRMV
jgi:hypothetical protein